jgi:hypothetical protein
MMASRGLRWVALAAAFESVAASPCEATFAHSNVTHIFGCHDDMLGAGFEQI